MKEFSRLVVLGCSFLALCLVSTTAQEIPAENKPIITIKTGKILKLGTDEVSVHTSFVQNTRARKAPSNATTPKKAATKQVDPGAAILQAKKDPANLIVVLDVSGKYTIFPASVIGEVNKNNVRLKANVPDALVADVAQTDYGPEQKVAEWLFKQWLTWRREAPAGNRHFSFAEGKVLAGELGGLKEDKTLEVERVLLVRKPQ